MPDSKTDKKWMDYAGLAAASVAYSEASRARAGVDRLQRELRSIKSDIESQNYEREFQKWVEELIYQFNKTVMAICESPKDPLKDWTDLV